MNLQKVSASAVVLNKEGKLLVVKRAEDDNFLPGTWELPGGGVDFLEEPRVGVRRELKEECGIDVDVLHPLTEFSFVMPTEEGEKHTVEIIYLCLLSDDSPPVSLSFEHSDYKWVSFAELEVICSTDFMIKSIRQLEFHPLVAGRSEVVVAAAI
jgi:8-oxo-dGTP diphosphatase